MQVIELKRRAEKLLNLQTVSMLTTLHEYKIEQNKGILREYTKGKLSETRIMQSTEAFSVFSCFAIDTDRLKKLALDKTLPKTREEQEVAGFRDLLKFIDENYAFIPLKSGQVQQLHKGLYKYVSSAAGGQFQNAEKAKLLDGLCEKYESGLAEAVDPLLMIPMFILDFLALCPFKTYYGEAVNWTAGHTYKISYALTAGNSLGFFYTSQPELDNQGPVNLWNIPEYCYDVLENIQFKEFYGAYKKGGSAISVTTDVFSVREEETLQLTVKVGQTSDKSVSWQSSDPALATVDENGLVTAVAAGTVTITATNSEGKSASVTLTILEKGTTQAEVTLKIFDVTRSVTAEIGKTMTAPEAPELLGYTFDGWYLGENAFDFNKVITGEMTLTAKYSLQEPEVEYNEIFSAGKIEKWIGGEEVVSESKKGNKYISFTFRTYNDMSNVSALYIELGARHIVISKDECYVASTWDGSRRAEIPADFIRIYDAAGNLVRDKVLWGAGGAVEEGSVSNSLQANTVYTVVINMDGRAWTDEQIGQYANEYDTAGFIIRACNGLKVETEYLGTSDGTTGE